MPAGIGSSQPPAGKPEMDKQKKINGGKKQEGKHILILKHMNV